MTRPNAGLARSGDYRLEVEDFGPISQASVDLRPLTVFVGPNNTGKSCLAILLYALHRSLKGMDPWPLGRHRLPGRPANQDRFRPVESAIRESLLSWISAAKPNPSLPPEVAESIRRNIERDGTLKAAMAGEICRCFGVDPLGALIRHSGSTGRATLSLGMPPESPTPSIGLQFVIGRKEHELQEIAWNSGLVPAATIRKIREFHDLADSTEPDVEYLFALLSDALLSQALAPVRRNAYYLPADRAGVMHSHQMVVTTLIQGATTARMWLGMETRPILSGVLADFLSELIWMGSEGGGRGRREQTLHLAASLEQNILAGAVQVKPNGVGYPGFTYRPQDWENDLPLIRTSSMVSELAPVVLYLRHQVRPGDVLIIEEPEAHLHPAMQTVLARELARMVRAGIRVVMTTHSEWLLEQIGNLVRLSNLPEDRRSGIGGADVALDPRQVGVWLFQTKEQPGGSVVKELALDPETGLFPADFDRVSDELYNEGAAIFNRIQEAGE